MKHIKMEPFIKKIRIYQKWKWKKENLPKVKVELKNNLNGKFVTAYFIIILQSFLSYACSFRKLNIYQSIRGITY